MSQHKVTIGTMKYVFGWDPPLQSFFFQVHDTELPEESNPIYWYGDASTRLYELEDLQKVMDKHGLKADLEMSTTLYLDKDEGR
jgi:hypothetical protein